MFLRLLLIFVLICVAWRWALGQWPWEALRIKPSKSQQIFRARKLLEIEEGADRKVIKAAHRRLIAEVHPDKGGSNAQVHEADAARDLLLAELPKDDAEKNVDQ
ncbi:MAG: J domain-containing protein [Erythrobacter sp.]